MPVNITLMNALKKQYGDKKGEDVYYSMERDNKPSFQKGLKTAVKQGHTSVKSSVKQNFLKKKK